MESNSNSNILAKDIMTKKVIALPPDTSLIEAARIISEHNFDGLPIINSDKILLGIVTEYDLINSASSASSSFFQQIMQDLGRAEKKEELTSENSGLLDMTVSDIMNKEPLVITEDTTFDEVLKTFAAHHKVNPIPVVNNKNELVGIISRFDVLQPLSLLGGGLGKR